MYLLLLGNNKAVRKHQKIGIRSLVRYLKISIKFKKLECDENKQLNFLLNSEKKLKDIIKTLYLKECLTKKKNMSAFTQRDQDQEYFTAVLRYKNLSLIIVPPFGPFYLGKFLVLVLSALKGWLGKKFKVFEIILKESPSKDYFNKLNINFINYLYW